MGKTTHLSKEKYEELVEELNTLKTKRRQEIADQLEVAKSYGDLSENAEYHEAREEQAKVEGRILELDELLKHVEIVKHHKSDVVEVGTGVEIQKKGEKETKKFEVVGSEEADTKAGKISLNSPLGQSMLGKKEGETFTYETPSGKKVNYKIVKIS